MKSIKSFWGQMHQKWFGPKIKEEPKKGFFASNPFSSSSNPESDSKSESVSNPPPSTNTNNGTSNAKPNFR